MPNNKAVATINNRNSHANRGRGKAAKAAAQASEIILHSIEKTTLVKVSAIDPNALTSKTQNDIIFPPNLIGNLLGNSIQFTCTNQTNSDIVFPAWGGLDMISYIDILLDGSRTPLVKLMPETMLFGMRYLAPDEIVSYKRGFMPPASGKIVAGASYTFYIPLLTDPLVLNHVFAMGFNELITYRVWFKPECWPGNIPVISNLSMIVRHSMPDASNLQSLRSYTLGNIFDYPFHQYIEQNFSRTVGASDVLSLDLTQFKAGVSDIMVYVRPAGEVLIGSLTQYLDQYSLQDSASTPILGLSTTDVIYQNSIVQANHKIRSVINPAAADPWVGIPLSSDVNGDYTSGSISGYYFFTGTEKLVLKFKAGISSGTYVITCVQGRIQNLKLDRGNVVLQKN